MATVFRKIRKNQKLWLATLGVLAMLCFVFIPIFMQNQGGIVGNGTVVTTAGLGSLDELQVQELHRQRVRLIRFFNALGNAINLSAQEKYEALLKSNFEDISLISKIQQQRSASASAIILARRLESGMDEQSLVHEWLQAKLAEKEGIVISDAMVNHFVNNLVDNLMTQKDYDLAKENAGIRTAQELDDAIRFLLAASEYRRVYEGNFNHLSIADQWDNFAKVNRFATLDVYPVAVADFVDDVPEPSQTELLHFFHENKERYSDPMTGAPGFKVRKQAELEYMMASADNFVNLDAVTEQEIMAFYEQFKQYYIKRPEIEMPEAGVPDMVNPFQNREREAPEGGLTLDGPVEEVPVTETPVEPVAETPVVEETPVEPVAETPVTEEAPAEPVAETPVVEETPAEPVAETPAEPVEEAPVAEETPVVETVTEETVVVEETPAEEAPAEEVPAVEEAPAEAEEAPEAPETPVETEEAKEAEETAGTGKSPFRHVAFGPSDTMGFAPTAPQGMQGLGSFAPQTVPQVEYQPLSEVRDEIRERVARIAASRVLHEKLAQAAEEMEAFNRAWQAYVIRKERAETTKTEFTEEAPKFDFADLAKRYGFLVVEPPKVYDVVDLFELPIGRSQTLNTNEPFAEFLFAGSAEFMEYISFTTMDDEANYYLGWTIRRMPTRVPTMEDEGMAEKVRMAWKFEKARPLAEAAAKAVADECTAAGTMESLGEKVLTTNSFSWYTFGELNELQMQHSTPVLSIVEGIDTPTKKNAGPKFMETTFSLAGTKCDIAPATDRSVFYVLQAKSIAPSDEVLQQMFSLDGAVSYQTVATMKMREVAVEWLRHLEAKANLDWKRRPRRMVEEEE